MMFWGWFYSNFSFRYPSHLFLTTLQPGMDVAGEILAVVTCADSFSRLVGVGLARVLGQQGLSRSM